MSLEIKNLHVSVDGKEILKGITLQMEKGEVHALMGPNGSGKTSLSFALMGHPKYKIERGEIVFEGQDITKLSTDKRAKLGLFLGFQYPVAVSGVTVSNFLWTAYKNLQSNGNQKFVSRIDFNDLLSEKLKLLGMDSSFADRHLNDNFSGGEKKRTEILQLAVLQQPFALLDETDSGTDIDALKIISNGINRLVNEQKMGILLITHYNRILNYVKPDFVHILVDGRIIKSGKAELADEIETKGYGWLENNSS